VLTDQPGKQSWPMTGASFILMHKEPKDPARALEVMKFFSWALKSGGKSATDLDFVPIPNVVVKQIEDYWKVSIKAGGAAVWK
jgi:phosphate transport system substrate-binding protein